METALGLPGDAADARVLALLAAGELNRHGWAVAVVVGGLDEQPARVSRSGLGDPALAASLVGGALRGDDAQVVAQRAWVVEAAKAPTSAAIPLAESVSMPRKQRKREIGSANGLSGTSLVSARSRAERRSSRASIAVR